MRRLLMCAVTVLGLVSAGCGGNRSCSGGYGSGYGSSHGYYGHQHHQHSSGCGCGHAVTYHYY